MLHPITSILVLHMLHLMKSYENHSDATVYARVAL